MMISTLQKKAIEVLTNSPSFGSKTVKVKAQLVQLHKLGILELRASENATHHTRTVYSLTEEGLAQQQILQQTAPSLDQLKDSTALADRHALLLLSATKTSSFHASLLEGLTGIPRASISRVISPLIQAGLISKKVFRDPLLSSVDYYRLTPEGRELRKALLNHHDLA
jgi:DNA-binding MarR family transcriptional regulator